MRLRDVHQLVERLPPGDSPRVSEVVAHQAKLLLAHPDLVGRSIGARVDNHVFEPERMLDYATIYASLLGRREVVELLLVEDPDLTAIDPVWHSTALGAARYPHGAAGRPNGSPEIASTLEAAAKSRSRRDAD